MDSVNSPAGGGPRSVGKALRFALKRYNIAAPLVWGVVVSFVLGTVINILKQTDSIPEVKSKFCED
jgi:hypothetical protein